MEWNGIDRWMDRFLRNESKDISTQRYEPSILITVDNRNDFLTYIHVLVAAGLSCMIEVLLIARNLQQAAKCKRIILARRRLAYKI